ncbi:MAG TPA: hypothetical protein VEP90_27260 [Methylomirabilota bacterium]|nr:hypothetical protein [Methylomirabilota bacterium]
MVYKRCKRCFGPLEKPKDFDSECEECKKTPPFEPEKIMTIDADKAIDEVLGKPDEQYPWATTPEEQRRTFIFDRMGDADIETALLIEKMQKVYNWLTNGPHGFKIVGKNVS